MSKEKINLMDFMNKEFYIIDCIDFTYFARTVHVIGFECSLNEIIFITDIKDKMMNEYRKICKEALEELKNFEEASQKAKQLNEMPKNKKRREDYFRDRQTLLEMQYYIQQY